MNRVRISLLVASILALPAPSSSLANPTGAAHSEDYWQDWGLFSVLAGSSWDVKDFRYPEAKRLSANYEWVVPGTVLRVTEGTTVEEYRLAPRRGLFIRTNEQLDSIYRGKSIEILRDGSVKIQRMFRDGGFVVTHMRFVSDDIINSYGYMIMPDGTVTPEKLNSTITRSGSSVRNIYGRMEAERDPVPVQNAQSSFVPSEPTDAEIEAAFAELAAENSGAQYWAGQMDQMARDSQAAAARSMAELQAKADRERRALAANQQNSGQAPAARFSPPVNAQPYRPDPQPSITPYRSLEGSGTGSWETSGMSEAKASPGSASTATDANRCVTTAEVKMNATFKGNTSASVINGCGQPVDVLICLKRESDWNCGVDSGVAPQSAAVHSSFNATGPVHVDARITGSTRKFQYP